MTRRRDRRADPPADPVDEPAPDEDDGEDDGEDSELLPGSSIDDLTTPADPTSFDETFTDDGASLDILGGFDPTAGPKQVIPRVAYTINYNLVWNPERERWEPDEGNGTADEEPAEEDVPINVTSGINVAVVANHTTATIGSSTAVTVS